MSLETTVDLAVHLGYFKTFDMLSQGTYRLRLRSYTLDPQKQRVYAQPYLILDNRFSPTSNFQRLYEYSLNPRLQAAYSSSFFVRYCDQDTIINQIAIFRFPLLNTNGHEQEAFIEIDLLALELGETKDGKSVEVQSPRIRRERSMKMDFSL